LEIFMPRAHEGRLSRFSGRVARAGGQYRPELFYKIQVRIILLLLDNPKFGKPEMAKPRPGGRPSNGFQPGNRSGGRPRGTRDKYPQSVWQMIDQRGDRDPIDVISEYVTSNVTDPTLKLQAAGMLASHKYGRRPLDGRFGIVLGRLDGPTLLQVTRSGAVTFAQAGAILASLGLSVHRMSPPPEAFHLRGWMDTAFRLSGDIVPKHIASGILALIALALSVPDLSRIEEGDTPCPAG
jgi:hypothetical protein